MSDIDELFKYYREECIPAYADLVGYLADKPVQFLIEIENVFAHVAQYYNPDLSQSEKERNIVKAQQHLYRLTLDCYKLLWVSMNADITKAHPDWFKTSEFHRKYNSFMEKAKDARQLELSSIGIQPLKALDAYKETVAIGQDLLNYINSDMSVSQSILGGISPKMHMLNVFFFLIGVILVVLVVLFIFKLI